MIPTEPHSSIEFSIIQSGHSSHPLGSTSYPPATAPAYVSLQFSNFYVNDLASTVPDAEDRRYT
jgi:hypothetical protein